MQQQVEPPQHGLARAQRAGERREAVRADCILRQIELLQRAVLRESFGQRCGAAAPDGVALEPDRPAAAAAKEK